MLFLLRCSPPLPSSHSLSPLLPSHFLITHILPPHLMPSPFHSPFVLWPLLPSTYFFSSLNSLSLFFFLVCSFLRPTLFQTLLPHFLFSSKPIKAERLLLSCGVKIKNSIKGPRQNERNSISYNCQTEMRSIKYHRSAMLIDSDF